MRLAAALLAAALTPALGQEPSPPAPLPSGTLRVEVAVVSLYCTVKDPAGRLVTDLAASDFEVQEDGGRQAVRYFSRETDQPLTLALLLDTSISQKEVMPAEKETAAQFLRQILRPVDRALLMTFDFDLSLAQDFTADPARLQQALHNARLSAPVAPARTKASSVGGTRLYDAVAHVASKNLAGAGDRKAIILLSDGVDAGSRATYQQALEAAQRADAIVYAIRIADPGYYWRLQNRASGGDHALTQLAQATGGRPLFTSNRKQLQAAFDQIASELRSQYSLGYAPSNRARDGRFRKIEVTVKRNGLKVYARRGYFAPTP